MNFLSIMTELLADSGFAALTWQSGVMIVISFVLLYLAIVKKFEPVPREKPHTGAAAREQPRDSPVIAR